MKNLIVSMLLVFVFSLIFVACGGGSSNGTGSSDWGDSEESNSSESGYGGSSGGNGSGGYNDNNDEDLKFQILDMNGNPITSLVIQDGAESAGFQFYNGTGQNISWSVYSSCYYTSDRFETAACFDSIDPDAGVLEPGKSAAVVLEINPLVYSYELNESSSYLSISADTSYRLNIHFPEKKIPECSPETSSTLCVDSSSGLMWTAKGDPSLYNDWHVWEFAVDYCDAYIEGGNYDWHLPTIDELRTLIKNCPVTESGGSCPVSERSGALSKQYIEQCSGCGSGNFSKFGERDNLWSSSGVSDDPDSAWYLSFSNAAVSTGHKEYDYFDFEEETPPMGVRCVRTEK